MAVTIQGHRRAIRGACSFAPARRGIGGFARRREVVIGEEAALRVAVSRLPVSRDAVCAPCQPTVLLCVVSPNIPSAAQGTELAHRDSIDVATTATHRLQHPTREVTRGRVGFHGARAGDPDRRRITRAGRSDHVPPHTEGRLRRSKSGARSGLRPYVFDIRTTPST